MSEDKQNDPTGPAANALTLGNEIKQIVTGTKIEKDAMILGAMYQSGYFKDTKSLSQAITKALIGAEMGMGIVQAMNSLYVIDGRVSMDSHAIRNIAVMSGYSITTKKLDETVCILEWSYRNPDTKKDEVLGTSEFTWEDAIKANLSNKSNWKQYPKDMLFARAITRGARMYANKAFANQPVYERDEINENAQYIDIGPLDERAEKVRSSETLEELKQVVDGLNAEEQKALADLIGNKTKEILNARSSSSDSDTSAAKE